MTRNQLVLGGAVAAALAVAAGGYWIVVGPPGAGAPMKAGDIDPKTGRRVLYWTDPMIPGFKSDHPGKSPMNMEMIPIYAASAPAAAAPAVDGGIHDAVGVRTAPVTLGMLQPQVQGVGTVAYDERSETILQARAAGFVQRLFVRATYDPVRRGQAIATILTPQFAAVQEDFLALRRHPIPGVGDLTGAARERMRLAGMTPGEIAAVTRTGRARSTVAVASPVNGVVTELDVREGMTVSAGQTLARIAALDPAWIDVQVSEAGAAQLRPGGPARIQAAGRNEPFPGRILALLPAVSPETRTRSIRVEVANRGRALVPGMTVTATFTPAGTATRLLVPSDAVIRTGRRNVVFVDRGARGYVPVEVTTGREAAGQTEILTGLSPNDRVAVAGQFLLDSEASLRRIEARAGAAPGGSR